MRPADVIRRGAEYLERHDVDSPLVAAEQLMMLVLGSDRSGVYARAEELRAGEARAYGRALCRRCTGTPLQHLTGTTGFRGLELTVRVGVFVPRPETEVLVQIALEALEDLREPIVVDVGTGTGAVALAIKHERPDAVVYATDASEEAVVLARHNAARLGLGIEVERGDLLTPLPMGLQIHLVASNPPYVPLAEEPGLPPEVLAEPRTAVFGEPEIYRRLFAQSAERLVPRGVVVVEIHEDAARDVGGIAEAAGFLEVEVHRDLAGRDRVISARRP